MVRGFEIKLNIKDVLAQRLLYFQDLDGDQKYSEGDNRWQETFFGQSVSLSLKYNI